MNYRVGRQNRTLGSHKIKNKQNRKSFHHKGLKNSVLNFKLNNYKCVRQIPARSFCHFHYNSAKSVETFYNQFLRIPLLLKLFWNCQDFFLRAKYVLARYISRDISREQRLFLTLTCPVLMCPVLMILCGERAFQQRLTYWNHGLVRRNILQKVAYGIFILSPSILFYSILNMFLWLKSYDLDFYKVNVSLLEENMWFGVLPAPRADSKKTT